MFVLPATPNGTTKVDFIVDSGAATVQIPEDVVDVMKRAGTVGEADFMGQHRFILADGRYHAATGWSGCGHCRSRQDDGQRAGHALGAPPGRAPCSARPSCSA